MDGIAKRTFCFKVCEGQELSSPTAKFPIGNMAAADIKKPIGGIKKPIGGIKKPIGGIKKPIGGIKKPIGGPARTVEC
jgi:hypothetical protein